MKESAKDVAWYSALVNADIRTRMELDRLIVLISAGGIAFLLFSLDKPLNFMFFLFSLFSFITSMTVGLDIFRRNALVLEHIINEGKEGKEGKILKIEDYILRSFFLSGFLFLILSFLDFLL